MVLIAHRAGTDRYPEQSIDAVRFSLSHGADMAEVDVRYTEDKNVPVICHDQNAKRIFGIDKDIDKMTLGEFLSLRRIASPEAFPYTLEDIFKLGLFPLLLHLKCSFREYNPLLSLIRRYGASGNVVLGAEETEGVRLIKDFDSSIKVLAFMRTEADLESFLQTDCDYIRLWEPWLAEERVKLVYSYGKKVWVMSGTFDTVGYTAFDHLRIWENMGCDGVLINEIVKAQCAMKVQNEKQ